MEYQLDIYGEMLLDQYQKRFPVYERIAQLAEEALCQAGLYPVSLMPFLRVLQKRNQFIEEHATMPPGRQPGCCEPSLLNVILC